MLFAITAAAPVAAQRPVDRNCSDDRGVDRCSEEQQRRTRQLFSVRSIEEHGAAGDQVRRVFYVDGYGRDVVLIAFVRAPGRDPVVSVHFPRREVDGTETPLQAAVPMAVWNEVIDRSGTFHRRFVAAPESSAGSGVIVLCMHSWVYTIEASDPGGLQNERIRRKTEDACEDGPGEVYADDIERLALSLIPHCAALAPDQYRNRAALLSACRILRGDRLAAAEVRNRADAFTHVEGLSDSGMISGLFGNDAAVVWNGERHTGRGYEADEFWAARMASSGDGTAFFIHSVEGVSADRVRLSGSLWRPTGTLCSQSPGSDAAAVEQVWTRMNRGEFLVEEATVSPWRCESAN